MFQHMLCQGMTSDTSAAESEIDDQCSPTERRSSAFPCLAPVREDVSCKSREFCFIGNWCEFLTLLIRLIVNAGKGVRSKCLL